MEFERLHVIAKFGPEERLIDALVRLNFDYRSQIKGKRGMMPHPAVGQCVMEFIAVDGVPTRFIGTFDTMQNTSIISFSTLIMRS
jgi:isocitrate dehydrogenase